MIVTLVMSKAIHLKYTTCIQPPHLPTTTRLVNYSRHLEIGSRKRTACKHAITATQNQKVQPTSIAPLFLLFNIVTPFVFTKLSEPPFQSIPLNYVKAVIQ